MISHCAVEDLVARSISIVDRYHLVVKTWSTWGAMVEEIRAVSAEADRSSFPRPSISSRLLDELRERYAPETAARLHFEFERILDALPEPGQDWIRSTSKGTPKGKRLASTQPSASVDVLGVGRS